MSLPDGRALLVLAFGVLCVSTAAIFIRLADAPPLVIATYRLLFASAVLAPLALGAARDEIAALSRSDVLRLVASGAVLAAHFALWITSLEHTTVASSVVLVTTNPLFVGLAAPMLLGETVRRRLLAGIGVAFVGGALIAWGDFALGGHALLGDGLALGGAVAAAAYFMIGRSVRVRVGLLPYIALVYGVAAIILLAASVATRQPMTGFDGRTWGCFVLLALVPQVLGHSSFNWALQHLSATFVAGAVLGEPIGSTLLAWWILAEAPPAVTLVGGALILAGLALAAGGEVGAGSRPVPSEP